jgi:hypothetical protein
MAEDKADLIEGHAMAQHLGSRRLSKKMGAFDGCLDPRTPQRVLDHG